MHINFEQSSITFSLVRMGRRCFYEEKSISSTNLEEQWLLFHSVNDNSVNVNYWGTVCGDMVKKSIWNVCEQRWINCREEMKIIF